MHTHQAALTEALHAQEGLKQAEATWQASSAVNTAADDDKYAPLDNPITSILVLATIRGMFIDFFHEFEQVSKKHALH